MAKINGKNHVDFHRYFPVEYDNYNDVNNRFHEHRPKRKAIDFVRRVPRSSTSSFVDTSSAQYRCQCGRDDDESESERRTKGKHCRRPDSEAAEDGRITLRTANTLQITDEGAERKKTVNSGVNI